MDATAGNPGPRSAVLVQAKARAYAKVQEAELARAAVVAAKARKGKGRAVTGEEDDPDEEWARIKKDRVYRCNLCGDEFYSFQALGGHCNSHRRIKLLFGGLTNDEQQIAAAKGNKRTTTTSNRHAAAAAAAPLPLAQFTAANVVSLPPPPPAPLPSAAAAAAQNIFFPGGRGGGLPQPQTLAPWTTINMHAANGAWNPNHNNFQPVINVIPEAKFNWPVEKEAEAALELQLNPYGTNLLTPKNEIIEEEGDEDDDKWVNAIIVDPYQQTADHHPLPAAPKEEELDLSLHL